MPHDTQGDIVRPGATRRSAARRLGEFELQGGRVVVSGERKEEQQQEGKTFLRVERRYGTFRRAISLPGAVDEDRIDAQFEDGVLRITLPKTEQQKARQIPIRAQNA